MKRRFGLGDSHLVVAGQALGQILVLAVTPFLTRTFAPAELGIYQATLAIALLLQPLSTLRVEFAIPAMKAPSAVTRSLRQASAMAGGLALLLAAIGCVLFAWGATEPAIVVFMVIVLNIPYSWSAVDNALLVRGQHLRRLGMRNLLFGVFASVLQVVVCLVAPSVLNLALAVLFGRVGAVIATRHSGMSKKPIGDGKDDFFYGPKRMAGTVLSGVLSSAVANGLTIVTALLVGRAAAGYVGTAQRVTSIPATFVGQGVSQVVQAAASRAMRDKVSMWVTLRSIAVQLVMLALLSGIAVATLGPILVVPALGPAWGALEVLLPMMATPIALQLVAASFSPVLAMIGRVRALVVMNALRLLATLGAASFAALVWGDVYAVVLAYSIAAAIAFIAQLMVTGYWIRDFDRGKLEE